METQERYTRLLGLALRGGRLLTGSDAVQSAVRVKAARLLLLSADASRRTCQDAEAWSERGECLLLTLPCGKEELGRALGRGTVAVAALTDTGLAAAVGERLAALDPERYGPAAERLKRKAERAVERRARRTRPRPPDAAGRKPGAETRSRPPNRKGKSRRGEGGGHS